MKRLFITSSLIISSTTLAKFSSQTELGLISQSGNTSLETYNFKMINTKEFKSSKIELSGHYTYGTSDKELSARNWDIMLKGNKTLYKRLGAVASVQVEGDEFAGIDQRYNNDIGLSYNFLKTEKHLIDSELAYRYTVQMPVEVNQNLPTEHFNKGLIVGYYKYTKNENLSVDVRAEYTPNFSETTDWELKFNTALYNSINSIFKVKVEYEWKKDNLPEIASTPYDRKFTTSLIANF